MKAREARRKVFVPARMRCDGQWGDVQVLDMSSRGCLLQSDAAPGRGAYIELARGPQRVVARVVWSRQQKFGVHTQDLVSVDAFLQARPIKAVATDPTAEVSRTNDRRSAARLGEAQKQRFERNRQIGQIVEYGSVVGLGAMLATLIFSLVQQLLSQPLSLASAALAAN